MSNTKLVRGVLQTTAKSKIKFIFSYGSNMDLERITKRVGGVSYFSFPCYVPGMEFKYNAGKTSALKNVYANINKSEDINSRVYGIVQVLNLKQVNMLDYCEGVPDMYNRHKIEVFPHKHNQTFIGFNSIIAETYITTKEYTYKDDFSFKEHFIRPTKEYINYILKGAMQIGVPEEYIKDKLIPSKSLFNG